MTSNVWRVVGLVAALGIGPAAGVSAQTPAPAQRPAAPDPAVQEADRYLQAMDWTRAVDAYEKVVRRSPSNAQAWFHLGVVAAQVQDYRRAAEAFERAGTLGLADSPKMAWEAALAYARLNRPDKTIEWLSTVVSGGLRSQVLSSTPELEFVRGDPSFQALLARATGNDRSCSGAAYRGLEFWVGEWAIYDEDRVRVGTSRVTRTPDGCALIETWTGTLGDGGRSLSYFVPEAGRWAQVWIGDTGGVVQQVGVTVDGELRLQGETVRPDGTKAMNRQTLSSIGGGRLRQRAEISQDGGRTWLPQFEFTGVRITR